MWSFYQFLGELLKRPSPRMEKLTPWIVTILGGLIFALMAYAWWTAPAI